MNLDWLNNFIDKLPIDSNYQRSFFDISGFPRWETVNSNLLAFYFDNEGEHGFKTLFIESLLMLLNREQNVNFDDNFDVYREYRTHKGNYIDIVIKSNPEKEESLNVNSDNYDEEVKKSDWAIIIENKIDASLNNNLTDYWNSVNAKIKIGVVLSKNQINLKRFNKNENRFSSITHKDLISQVQENIHSCFSYANEKHLLFLKEYINNIDNLYFNDIMEENNSKVLSQFHLYNDEIIKLHEYESRLLKYITTEVFELFEEFGFKPYSSKTTSKTKHFYASEGVRDKYDSFRFFVNFTRVLFHKEFNACFELHQKSNTKYGTELKEALSNINVFSEYITKGSGGGDKGGYNHIYVIRIPIDVKPKQDFSDVLKKQLKTHFFENPKNFLENASKELEVIKSKHNNLNK